MSDRDSRERKAAWAARLGAIFLRALAGTWRVRVLNDGFVRQPREQRKPIMYVCWHGQLLPLIWAHRNHEIAIMVSEHSDGELITRIARSLGFRAIRGSTSRGGARALLGACRELESGFDIAVTPDGPRGPARSVAPGAVVISHRTGAPMVPVAVFADRAWRLKSWDQFIIPKPFARVTVAYSNPIRVAADTARDASTQELENVRAGIDQAGEIAAAE